jgi:hypothetical protein
MKKVKRKDRNKKIRTRFKRDEMKEEQVNKVKKNERQNQIRQKTEAVRAQNSGYELSVHEPCPLGLFTRGRVC